MIQAIGISVRATEKKPWLWYRFTSFAGNKATQEEELYR